MEHTKEDIDFLLSPEAIRQRCHKLYEEVKLGRGQFEIHEEKLPECADYVLEVIKSNYPSLDIPFHSRWSHFQVGNIDRLGALKEKLSSDKLEKSRAMLDLVIVSVLLDAGAGMQWKYTDGLHKFGKSEGLAVASIEMFKAGLFSNDGTLRCDGKALENLDLSKLEIGFQISSDNPMIGLEGRKSLLNQLGALCQKSSAFKDDRPGNIVDALIEKHGHEFKVRHILDFILKEFGAIWPGRITLSETNLGDVWTHPLLGDENKIESLVPFHKLSQWLTYSLVGALEEAGLKITGAQELTGLCEYRNGGLFLDSQVITLKDESLVNQEHAPGSTLIIEWRALTLVLLDKCAELIRKNLGFNEEEFPLAKVLEGGTWWAGRKMASAARENGGPPLNLKSDGTVF